MDSSDRTTISLPGSLHRRLRYEAARGNRPVSAVVRDALERYLGEQEPVPLPEFTGVGEGDGTDLRGRVKEAIGEEVERKFSGR